MLCVWYVVCTYICGLCIVWACVGCGVCECVCVCVSMTEWSLCRTLDLFCPLSHEVRRLPTAPGLLEGVSLLSAHEGWNQQEAVRSKALLTHSDWSLFQSLGSPAVCQLIKPAKEPMPVSAYTHTPADTHTCRCTHHTYTHQHTHIHPIPHTHTPHTTRHTAHTHHTHPHAAHTQAAQTTHTTHIHHILTTHTHTPPPHTYAQQTPHNPHRYHKHAAHTYHIH